jgi:hypothetical protein
MVEQDRVKDLEILVKCEQLDAIQDAIAEKRLADRVLLSGRRVPLESAPPRRVRSSALFQQQPGPSSLH